MLVTANKRFRYDNNWIERGQELDIEEPLASRLVRTKYCLEPDQTREKTRLVVTHRPRKTEVTEEIVTDENDRPVVKYVVMEGAIGREQPKLLTPQEAKEVTLPFGVEKTRNRNGGLAYRLVRYRTHRRTTNKRGFDWNGQWINPGDTFPADCDERKIYNLKASGYTKEVKDNGGAPPKKRRGRPKGSKNKKRP